MVLKVTVYTIVMICLFGWYLCLREMPVMEDEDIDAHLTGDIGPLS